MKLQFKNLGTNKEELNELIKFGLKYDKRQKKQMLASTKHHNPNIEDIQLFENEIGSKLPADYRNFLLQQNGGIPNKHLINIPNNGNSIVQSLYALINVLPNVTLRQRLSVYKDRIPQSMLPIGDDPAGNLYLLDLSEGERYGKIYFWDHEFEADHEKQPYYKNIIFISNSFAEFLDGFY